MPRMLRRSITAVLATSVAAAVLAPTASAGILTASATGCRDYPLSQPFERWNDLANYRHVPGGAFEQGAAGWQLSGGARVVAGNESFKVRSAADKMSLLLPAGSTATTPTVCVGLAEPTMRFFARRASGLLTTLSVEVQVETSLGVVLTLPVLPGDLGGGSWHPTLPHPLLVNLLPLPARRPHPGALPLPPAAARQLADRRRLRRSVQDALIAARRTSPGAAS